MELLRLRFIGFHRLEDVIKAFMQKILTLMRQGF